jgi:predicted ATPase/class 3 adenylate cyclase
MSNSFSTILSYLPPTLIRALLRQPEPHTEPLAEHFTAAVLFADLSGFTALTEALAQKGAEGPEEITRLLNLCFGQLIEIVAAAGGEVVKFGGDALTVLFPAEPQALSEATRRAQQTAVAMQQAMTQFAALRTSVGVVSLGMKIGIGAGEVSALHVGGVFDRWEFLIAGDALHQAATIENQAQRGEIILSPAAVENSKFAVQPSTVNPQPSIANIQYPNEFLLRRYVPSNVLNWLGEGLREWLGVLRPMSVLFIKLHGVDYSTAEAVSHLHNFFRLAQDTIYRYEGSINKLSVDDKGTVLLALFGAPPFAHEDDALRAIRAAQDLQRLITTQLTSLTLSIGIATGRVFAGPVGNDIRREYTVMGDAVNLSARLMGQAAAGSIVCEGETYRQARARIPFETLPPVWLKGKAALTPIYRPLNVERGGWGAERADSPHAPRSTLHTLVGRQTEIARFKQALTTLNARRGRVIIIEGEAGIGKSRLVMELQRLASERGLTGLLGAAFSIEQQTPYRAWRDVFHSYFNLEAIPSAQERQQHVRRVVQDNAPQELERLPLLNDILNLGLPDTELTASLDAALRQQGLTVLVVALLRAWMRARPLLLILEDTHWLDSLSWELTVQVARAFSAANDPMLFALAMRPLDEHAPALRPFNQLLVLRDTEHLRLTTLTPAETVALVTTRLGLPADSLPAPITELVRQRAGGNPFFAEELVFTLRDQNFIRIEPDPTTSTNRCVITEQWAQATQPLPDTVQGLILSRIDRLPPEQQLVLKVGAVIGRTFPYSTLAYTLNAHTPIDDARLKTDLTALATLDLTPLDVPEPNLTYIFKHIITQEVAYQTLLFTQRRSLHHTVAVWYEQHQPAPIPLLVHHYHYAEEPEHERHYAQLAGQQAAAQFANAEAVAYFTRALELTHEQDEAGRYALLLAREKVYELQGAREAQRRDLDSLHALAETMNDAQRKAAVALLRAQYADITSDYATAIRAAQTAIEFARAVDDVLAEATGYFHWASALTHRGDYAEARTLLGRALMLAHNADLYALSADARRLHGTIAASQGNYREAETSHQQSLQLYRLLNDRRGESLALGSLGIVANFTGNARAARDYLEQALRLDREVGDRRGEATRLVNLGIVTNRHGDYTSAQRYFTQALLLAREIDERRIEGAALGSLGNIGTTHGDYVAAQRYYEQALSLFRAIGDRRLENTVLSNLGRLFHYLKDDESARSYSAQSLELAQTLGSREHQADSLTYLGHALVGLQRWEEAAQAYQQALTLRRELKQTPRTLESLAGLARAALAQRNVALAQQSSEEILQYLAAHSIESLDDPFEIYLTCYRTLQANADPRAATILAQAHQLLQTRAAQLDDETMRQSFLNNVQAHREIVEEIERLRVEG